MSIRLRNVEESDVDAYVRMRCDPEMMTELGGPVPREGIEAKVRRDAAEACADTSWIKMIVTDDPDPNTVAGSVVLWSHEDGGTPISEVGWMVLPQFQGRGIAKQAVRALLDAAHADGRWGTVHAFPGVTNAPSNGICRSLGFQLVGRQDVTFADRILHTNHWMLHPHTRSA